MLKICFVGLGSIGTRHLKNLQSILSDKNIPFQIHALRVGNTKGNYKKTGIDKEFFSSDDLACDYDITFITNPTFMHYQTLKDVINKTKYVFLEKPAFESIDYDLGFVKNRQNDIYIACPLRYSAVFEHIKQIVANKKVFATRVFCSTYLPDWRPDADYKTSYSAFETMGGGVDIDLIHELDYVTNLFSFPQKVLLEKGKFSDLEINSVDLASYILCYPDKLISVHLDYFGRFPQRNIELFMQDDIIVGDFINSNITYKSSGLKIDLEQNRDKYQIKELETFLEIVFNKKRNPNNIENAIKVLKLAKGVL